MICSPCGSENAHNRLYCWNCGARLGAPCPSCGFNNADTDKFCGACGIALSVVAGGSSKPLKGEAQTKRRSVASGVPAPIRHRFSEAEITELMGTRQSATGTAASKLLSQDDLDKLFVHGKTSTDSHVGTEEVSSLDRKPQPAPSSETPSPQQEVQAKRKAASRSRSKSKSKPKTESSAKSAESSNAASDAKP